MNLSEAYSKQAILWFYIRAIFIPVRISWRFLPMSKIRIKRNKNCETKVYLFAGGMIFYIENLPNS